MYRYRHIHISTHTHTYMYIYIPMIFVVLLLLLCVVASKAEDSNFENAESEFNSEFLRSLNKEGSVTRTHVKSTPKMGRGVFASTDVKADDVLFTVRVGFEAYRKLDSLFISLTIT